MAVRYSKEIADRICADLAKGMTLRAVCRQDGMPDHSSVFGWLDEHEGFANQYARARERGWLVMADEILDIADDSKAEWGRSRLQIDTRKWLLSKALPKIYGDRLQTQQLGKDGQPVDPASVQPIINLTVAKSE